MKTKWKWLCYCGILLYIISLCGGICASFGSKTDSLVAQSIYVGFCICGILFVFEWYNMNRFNELKELIEERKQ